MKRNRMDYQADISDLTTVDRSHPTPTRARSVTIPPRMGLASKNPPGGANCDARHNAPSILTDTSPAFRPLFAHSLRQRSPVSRLAPERPDPPNHRPHHPSVQMALRQ